MSEKTMVYIRNILDREGWNYEVSEEEILLVAAFRGRKWKVVISCSGDAQLCCYAVYPWIIPAGRLERLFSFINEMNLSQRRGCFMVNTADRKVIFRCGVKILDEYTGDDYAADMLLSCIAAANANWEKVAGIVCGNPAAKDLQNI